MVAPPTKPRKEKGISCGRPRPASSSSTSSYTTLESLSTILLKALPLRIELMEGYMSNSVPQITFSTSDMFNIHLAKQQEVRGCHGVGERLASSPYQELFSKKYIVSCVCVFVCLCRW